MNISFSPRPARQLVRRAAFVSQAIELLPHCRDEIEAQATVIYGAEPVIEDRFLFSREVKIDAFSPRRRQIQKRINFFKAITEAFTLTLTGDTAPDGCLDKRVGTALATAAKMGVTINPLPVDENGVRLSWGTGSYHLVRHLFLPAESGFTTNGFLLIDDDLLGRGGYFKVTALSNGYRLVSLNKELTQWKLILRLMRKLNQLGRTELARRWDAGQRFEVKKANRNEVDVIIKPGRMPKALAQQLADSKALYEARISRLEFVVDELTQQGAAEAQQWAAKPAQKASEAANHYRQAVEDMEHARKSLREVMPLICYKDVLASFSFDDVPAFWPRAKLSAPTGPAYRYPLARDRFTDAVKLAKSLGWVPPLPAAETQRPNVAAAGPAQRSDGKELVLMAS